MLTCRIEKNCYFSRKMDTLVLAFFSVSGILLGVSISYSSDLILFSMMHRMLTSPVTIVGLVSVNLLPFLITAIAICLSKPYLIFLLAFFKCFLYAFVRCGISIYFFQAGWLIGALLLSDSIVIALLHWYWIRHLHAFRKNAIKDMAFCLLVALATCLIDNLWVSPFLITLISD